VIFALLLAASAPLYDCRVVDGDTIRCGDERIRLLAIDAAEMRGHCRRGRVCVPGDPIAARKSLQQATSPYMRIQRVGKDRYGRTLGLVHGPAGDLSCFQLRAGQAFYKPRWDNGRRVAAMCPEATRDVHN